MGKPVDKGHGAVAKEVQLAADWWYVVLADGTHEIQRRKGGTIDHGATRTKVVEARIKMGMTAADAAKVPVVVSDVDEAMQVKVPQPVVGRFAVNPAAAAALKAAL